MLKHVMWEDLQQHPGWRYLGCALHVRTLLWTKPHKLQGWFNSHKAISAGQEKNGLGTFWKGLNVSGQ